MNAVIETFPDLSLYNLILLNINNTARIIRSAFTNEQWCCKYHWLLLPGLKLCLIISHGMQ